jgi:hypothetical protein
MRDLAVLFLKLECPVWLGKSSSKLLTRNKTINSRELIKVIGRYMVEKPYGSSYSVTRLQNLNP